MDRKSFANGNGNSVGNGPDMRAGSPIPKYMQGPAYLDARAMTVTFWDLT